MTADRLGLAAVAVATLACLRLVPAFPLAHLDDPAHWGVIGYLVILVGLARHRLARPPSGAGERRILVLCLAGMPMVYLASWARFGGGTGALALEAAGALGYLATARLARSRPRLLAAGLAAHGLWDLAHYRRSEYVADWYSLACLIVDLALAVYVVGRAPSWARSG